MDVLDAISYMLLFLAAGPFLDKLFLKQGDTVTAIIKATEVMIQTD